MECSINNPALSLSMKHLVIGQRQKAPNFSPFHWSPHGSLVSIGQHFITTRVVHLPKRTETSLITKSDQSGLNHQLLQLCTACTAWSDSDQAVRAVHSCNSWLFTIMKKVVTTFFVSLIQGQEDTGYWYSTVYLYLASHLFKIFQVLYSHSCRKNRYVSRNIVNGYTFREATHFVIFIVASHINWESSHKGKNLLPSEQILSLTSRPHFRKNSSSS